MKAGVKTGLGKALSIPGDAERVATNQKRATVPPEDLPVTVTAILVSQFLCELLLLIATQGKEPEGTDAHMLFIIALFSVLVGQACLLAIWVCLGTNPWYTRLGFFVGGVCLLGILTIGVGFVASLLVAGLLLVVRFCGFRLCTNSYRHIGLAPMQFSIRHMLILTFLVACLLPLRGLMAWILHERELRAAIIAFTTVGIASVWAVFGNRHSVLATIGLVVLAVGIGFASAVTLLPSHLFTAQIGCYFALATFVQGMVLVVSLHLVRSCGFRLVRVSPDKPIAAARAKGGQRHGKPKIAMKPGVRTGLGKRLPIPEDTEQFAPIPQQGALPPVDLSVRITGLLAGQFLVGFLVFALRSEMHALHPSVPLVLGSILLGVVCLLAIWACLATSPWYAGLGLLVAAVYSLSQVMTLTVTSCFGEMTALVGLLAAGLLLVPTAIWASASAQTPRRRTRPPLSQSPNAATLEARRSCQFTSPKR
jgi:hypothetical protein